MAPRPVGPKATFGDKFKYMSDQTGIAGSDFRKYKNWLFENKELPGMTEIMMQYMFGAVMGQTFPAIFVFEWLLNHYPVDQIVEFGTGTGGLSAYLQFQADIRGLDFYTFDAKERLGHPLHGNDTGPANPPVRIKELVNFRQGNLWHEETQKEVRDILKSKRSLYYTDNGNKPKELKLFAPFTIRGSVVGTHDWNGQFGIDDLFRQLGMELIFQNICEEGKTKMRFWYKTT